MVLSILLLLMRIQLQCVFVFVWEVKGDSLFCSLLFFFFGTALLSRPLVLLSIMV